MPPPHVGILCLVVLFGDAVRPWIDQRTYQKARELQAASFDNELLLPPPSRAVMDNAHKSSRKVSRGSQAKRGAAGDGQGDSGGGGEGAGPLPPAEEAFGGGLVEDGRGEVLPAASFNHNGILLPVPSPVTVDGARNSSRRRPRGGRGRRAEEDEGLDGGQGDGGGGGGAGWGAVEEDGGAGVRASSDAWWEAGDEWTQPGEEAGEDRSLEEEDEDVDGSDGGGCWKASWVPSPMLRAQILEFEAAAAVAAAAAAVASAERRGRGDRVRGGSQAGSEAGPSEAGAVPGCQQQGVGGHDPRLGPLGAASSEDEDEGGNEGGRPTCWVPSRMLAEQLERLRLDGGGAGGGGLGSGAGGHVGGKQNGLGWQY